MSNYEHIMTQCRRFRSKKWDEAELRKCKELLCTLSREELFNVYRSRFLQAKHPLKEKREERIRTMPVEDLIAEFQDKKSGNVALARKEMHDRYKRNKGNERALIKQAFNNSTKADQQWIKSQERREEYERQYGKRYPEYKPYK